MADFCTKCSIEMFREDSEPDINVQEIFESLEPGYYLEGFICEGCYLSAIGKSDDGNLVVIDHTGNKMDYEI